ncbi:MAG: hypothetical protein CVU39_25900 [Chloroflexi bacterium HGW-Chloroflexi-10]|nr:MAG: hypothetical protein CVU39_25900 [Chloroflexi bacterium HGW-Chloroflexi-10]
MNTKISVAIIKKVILAGMGLVLLGTFFSVQPVSASGEAGYSLMFDGINDYVALDVTENIFGVDWKNSKSISIWIKPMGNAESCNFNDVAYCDAIIINRPRYFGIMRGIIAGQDRIWIWNYDNSTDKIGIEYTQDQWIHITMVHANGRLKAYRNANLVGNIASGQTNGSIPVVNSKLQLGAFLEEGSVGAFQGELDELRLYSIEVSQQDIVDNLRNELSIPVTGLGAYYKMSDGSGLILTDDSGNGWHGDLMNNILIDPENISYPLWVNPSTAFDNAVADDQIVMTDEDQAVMIGLTGSSPTGAELFFTIIEDPSNGVVSGTPPNLTYTPDLNFSGVDSFYFQVNDGITTSIESAVTIMVNPINDAPVANNIIGVTNEDTPVNIILDGSDVDVADVLSYVVGQEPQHGQLSGTGDNRTYTPHANYFGVDTFTYTVFDGLVSSAPATVTITIHAVNDIPVGVNDTYQVSQNSVLSEPAPGVLTNDHDLETLNLQAILISTTQHGVLNLSSNGSFTYSPFLNYNGEDQFTYTASDGFNQSNHVTVTLIVQPGDFQFTLFLPLVKN